MQHNKQYFEQLRKSGYVRVRVDDLKTRLFGSRTYVDAEIAVDGALPLRDAHAIAERVHHELEHDFPDVKHCTVHVNPA